MGISNAHWSDGRWTISIVHRSKKKCFPFCFLLISFQVFTLVNPRSLPVYIASNAFTSFAGASMTKA
jgi:hypothetical protein